MSEKKIVSSYFIQYMNKSIFKEIITGLIIFLRMVSVNTLHTIVQT